MVLCIATGVGASESNAAKGSVAYPAPLPELLREVRRDRPPEVFHRADAERRLLSVHGAAQVLEQDGYAGERAGTGFTGFGAGLVVPGANHRVQLRVDPVDAFDRRFDELFGADLAGADELCLGGCVEPREFRHGADVTRLCYRDRVQHLVVVISGRAG